MTDVEQRYAQWKARKAQESSADDSVERRYQAWLKKRKRSSFTDTGSTRTQRPISIFRKDQDTAQNWYQKSADVVNEIYQYYSDWKPQNEQKYQYFQNTTSGLLSDADKWRTQFASNDEALSAIDDVVSALETTNENLPKVYNHWAQWDTEGDYIKGAPENREKRQRIYEDNLVKIKALQEEMARLARAQASNNSAYSFGDTSMGFFLPVTDPSYSNRIKDIKMQIEALETENRQYERGEAGFAMKVLDDYYLAYMNDPGFLAAASNRDYHNASVEDLLRYKELNDAQNWSYDEDGNLRSADGALIAEDGKGGYYNPDSVGLNIVNDKLGLFINATEEDKRTGLSSSGIWRDIYKEGSAKNWDELEENELTLYYGLHGTQGQEAAEKFLDDIQPLLDQRATYSAIEKYQSQYDAADSFEKVLLNAETIPRQLESNVVGFLEDNIATLRGGDINPYSSAHAGMHFTQTIRGKTAQELDETGFKIPIVNFTLGDLYQSGMSMVDSLAAMGVGGSYGGVLLAMGAAESEAYELYKQGASVEQIALGAASAGAAELIFESISIGELDAIKNMRSTQTVAQIFKTMLVQGGVEASEEVLTEIANTVSNAFIMGTQSDWEQLMEESDGNLAKALLQKTLDVLHAAIGGFFSGAGSGGLVGNTSYIANRLSSSESSDKSKKSADIASTEEESNERPRYSLRIRHSNGTVEELSNARELTDAEALQYLNQAKTGEIRRDSYIPVRKDTPQVIIDTLKQVNEQIPNFSLVMQAQKARQAMGNEMPGNKNGKYGPNIRRHALQPDDIIEIMHNLDDPEMIIYQTNRTGKSGQTLPNNVSVFVKYQQGEAEGLAVIEFEGSINPENIGYAYGDTQYHTVVTVFEPDAERNGVDFDYAEELLRNPYNYQLEIERRQSARSVTGEKHPNTSRDVNMENNPDIINELPSGSMLTRESTQVNGAEKNGESPTQRTLHAVVNSSENAAANGKLSTDSIRNSRGNVKARGKGGVYYGYQGQRLNKLHLTAAQRVAVDFAERLAKKWGMTFYFYESQPDGLGRRVYRDKNGNWVRAEDGFYDPSDGSVHIDLNAGAYGQGAILFTVAHELTHHIQQWSPSAYNKLCDILTQGYLGAGQSLGIQVQLRQQMAQEAGRELTYKEAYDEVMAHSLESVLADGKVMQLLEQIEAEDKTLAARVRRFFRDVAQLIWETVDTYWGLQPDSPEGRMVLQMKDLCTQLEDTFAQGLYEAGQNFSVASNSTSIKGGRSVKYSVRETTDGRYAAVVDADILSHIDANTWNKDTKRAAKKAANAVLKSFSNGFIINNIEFIGNKSARDEYTRSNYSEALARKNPSLYLDKMRAAAILDDVIRVATDFKNDGALTHERADYIDFARGDALLMSADKAYKVVVLVGIKSNGDAVFYDIEDIRPDSFAIKESESSTAVATNESPNAILEDSDTITVAQSEADVKANDSAQYRYSVRQDLRQKNALAAAIRADVVHAHEALLQEMTGRGIDKRNAKLAASALIDAAYNRATQRQIDFLRYMRTESPYAAQYNAAMETVFPGSTGTVTSAPAQNASNQTLAQNKEIAYDIPTGNTDGGVINDQQRTEQDILDPRETASSVLKIQSGIRAQVGDRPGLSGSVGEGERGVPENRASERQQRRVNTDPTSLSGDNRKKILIAYGDTAAETEAIDAVVGRLCRQGKVLQTNHAALDRITNSVDWKQKALARKYIKEGLEQFLGISVVFQNSADAVEAYLTRSGINHAVAGMNIPPKAVLFNKFGELAQNAEYAYSSENDKHSNAGRKVNLDIDWDCYVALAQAGNRIYSVIFKLRTIQGEQRSQIYSVAIREETGLTHGGVRQETLPGAHPNYGELPISGKTIAQSGAGVKGSSAKNLSSEQSTQSDRSTAETSENVDDFQTKVLEKTAEADTIEESVREFSSFEAEYAGREIITDGSHMENGKPKANVVFRSGEHGYLYETDALGRIIRACTDHLKLKLHQGRLRHVRQTLDKLAGDHAGHLLGDLFGGSEKLDNLVSQARDVNKKVFFTLECTWKNALQAGKEVSVDIQLKYGDGMRPTAFAVTYYIDGIGYTTSINNTNDASSGESLNIQP